jgi:hypothetical protein
MSVFVSRHKKQTPRSGPSKRHTKVEALGRDNRGGARGGACGDITQDRKTWLEAYVQNVPGLLNPGQGWRNVVQECSTACNAASARSPTNWLAFWPYNNQHTSFFPEDPVFLDTRNSQTSQTSK